MSQTRLISFAGSTLTIEFRGSGPAQVVDFLYRHIPTGRPGPSALTYRLQNGETDAELWLYRGETLIYRGGCEGTAAELLLGDTCSQLAARSRTGLLFHAAALSWQGVGLILPGASGAGKSTLTAYLVGLGFEYLTDELVFVPWQADSIQIFTRPISLKKPARTVLGDIFDFEKQAASILSSPTTDLVPPTLFQTTQTRSEANLNLIIFPRYQATGSFELRQLSRAQAGLALMQTLINAHNLPEHGFSEIIRLVRHLPVYSLRYNCFDQIDLCLKNLIERDYMAWPQPD